MLALCWVLILSVFCAPWFTWVDLMVNLLNAGAVLGAHIECVLCSMVHLGRLDGEST